MKKADRRSEQICFRLTGEERKRVAASATADGRSLADWIRRTLLLAVAYQVKRSKQ